VVVCGVEDDRLRHSQRASQALGDLGPEPLDPPLVDQVLEPGVFAVVAVAVVVLHRHDGVEHLRQLLGSQRREAAGQAGEVSGLVWFLPMPRRPAP
jgi:hypothetical protein